MATKKNTTKANKSSRVNLENGDGFTPAACSEFLQDMELKMGPRALLIAEGLLKNSKNTHQSLDEIWKKTMAALQRGAKREARICECRLHLVSLSA